jgi:hypothetical protein
MCCYTDEFDLQSCARGLDLDVNGMYTYVNHNFAM